MVTENIKTNQVINELKQKKPENKNTTANIEKQCITLTNKVKENIVKNKLTYK